MNSPFRLILLFGCLDIAGTAEIETQFTALAVSEGRKSIVDLSEVTFLASIGIRSIISNAKALQQWGGKMVLVTSDNAQAQTTGHLPPIVSCDGQLSTLPIPKGTAIGIILGMSYKQLEITLSANDFVLCFTDGVTEAQTSDGELYSEKRLNDFVETVRIHRMETLLTRVRHEVANFRGSDRLDDSKGRSTASDLTITTVQIWTVT